MELVEWILDLVQDESKWLTMAMVFGLSAVFLGWARRRREEEAGREGSGGPRPEVLWAMNLFFGAVIGTMAVGHLLAVSVKLARGTLEGSPWFLYSIGVLLLIPSWGLVAQVGILRPNGNLSWKGNLISNWNRSRQVFGLNVWLGLTLVLLGPHNLPLALPALLNIGYQVQRKRALGWTIVTVLVLGNVVLFVGSLVFFVSGQTFEEFRGLE